ncbi:MAG TPA: molecular chaperone DnaK, partial [Thermoguttaceae bacterium]|nr:molecular chaperone DnaK [Thermoguttaceae bacterium]
GARVPSYGPLNTVVPAEAASQWLRKLIDHYGDDPTARLAAMQLARRTDDRYRDVSEKLRTRVLDWFDLQECPPHFIELVKRSGTLDAEERGLVFGEALPKGLRTS